MTPSEFDSAIRIGNYFREGQEPSKALLRMYFLRVSQLDVGEGEQMLRSIFRNPMISVECKACAEVSVIARTHTTPESKFRCASPECDRKWTGEEIEREIRRAGRVERVFPVSIII